MNSESSAMPGNNGQVSGEVIIAHDSASAARNNGERGARI